MRTERGEIVIVGSGFAGSILARILALQGREVVLVEKGRHPRFALGESATPLASLSLERLARTYGLEDLASLATYGRWSKHLPQLRRGLKRGFTFYQHRRGSPFENGPENENRLLVAASPDDEIADCHWLRADVDAFLVEQAVEAGVDYRPLTRLDDLCEAKGSITLRGEGPAGPVELAADLLIDATGNRGFVAGRLSLPTVADPQLPTRLIFGHFEGARDFAPRAREAGAILGPGPYADDRAAVHHLLDEGWLYALSFDSGPSEGGLVSAGLLTRGSGTALPAEAAAAWQEVLRRYPSLGRCFAGSRPLRPVEQVGSIRYRRASAVGERWLLLPHAYAFFDPLFSTGMAWSLVAVERVAQMLCGRKDPRPAAAQRMRYGELLAAEAGQISDLVEAAYLSFGDFQRFSALTQLYFAAASFQELSQRLLDPPGEGWAWQGFLGATDSISRAFVREGRRRLEPGKGSEGAFSEWVRGAISPRNAVGLCDPLCRNLYPVDLEALRRSASLLGLDERELEARLPRLRGAPRAIF